MAMMSVLRSRLRAALGRRRSRSRTPLADADACSWEAMRVVYQQQAARGDPDAIRGLMLIEQDRWPSDGRPRAR